jgi:hypothetical protein
MKRFAFAALCGFALLAAPGWASDDTVLVRVLGGVGYTMGADQPYNAITGQQLLEDGYFAVTRPHAQGMLLLPDSSQVGLGANTTIQVSAFQRASEGDGSIIALTRDGSAVRFNVKHPKGAHANYTFVTPSTNIAVRGTSGLIYTGGGRDIIVCLDCSAHTLVVKTADGKAYELTTGQMLTVTSHGATRTSTSTAALQMFAASGLTTAPSAPMPVAAASPGIVPNTAGSSPQRNMGIPPPTSTNGVSMPK